jgi:hypothetical protein
MPSGRPAAFQRPSSLAHGRPVASALASSQEATDAEKGARNCRREGPKGAACPSRPPVANRSTAGREAVKEGSGWNSTTALTGMPVQASAQVMLQYGRVLEAGGGALRQAFVSAQQPSHFCRCS